MRGGLHPANAPSRRRLRGFGSSPSLARPGCGVVTGRMSQVKVRKAAGIYQKIEAIVLVFERPMDKIARVILHFCGEQAIMDVVGSVMTEQGISFAVVQVHAYTVETQAEAEDAIQSYAKLFPGLPVVLM